MPFPISPPGVKGFGVPVLPNAPVGNWSANGSFVSMSPVGVTTPGGLPVNPVPALRAAFAQNQADAFCRATVEKWGVDETAVKEVLTTVNQSGVRPEFEMAVKVRLASAGESMASVDDVLTHEFAGDILDRTFKKTSLAETQDLWRSGQITYRSSPWQYRLRGMWGALEHFGNVVKQYPIASTTAIVLVTLLGHRFPFVGGLSGAVIFALSAGMTAKNEYKAFQLAGMGAEKSTYYRESGESLTALLLSVVGIDEIYKALRCGGTAFAEAKSAGLWRQTTAALNAVPKEGEGSSAFGLIRFVTGLLDDALIPFNWVADKLGKQKQSA